MEKLTSQAKGIISFRISQCSRRVQLSQGVSFPYPEPKYLGVQAFSKRSFVLNHSASAEVLKVESHDKNSAKLSEQTGYQRLSPISTFTGLSPYDTPKHDFCGVSEAAHQSGIVMGLL